MTIQKPIKPKKCPICKVEFTPSRPLQKVCSPICAVNLSKSKREMQERRNLKEAKEKIKTKSEHLKEAQRWFNKFIRIRDLNLPCISCGTTNRNIQYAAGHFRTVGSAPHLRFNEMNVHRQCNKHCNLEKSGNILAYRAGLIEKIGIDAVDKLEADNEPKHYTVDDIKKIKGIYKLKCKELENDQ